MRKTKKNQVENGKQVFNAGMNEPQVKGTNEHPEKTASDMQENNRIFDMVADYRIHAILKEENKKLKALHDHIIQQPKRRKAMTVRITFRSEVFIEGEDMREIVRKFNNLPLFSADALEDADADFCEVLSVEDADTYDDLEDEFNEAS